MMSWAIKKLRELSQRKDAVVSGPFGSNLKVSDYKDEGIPKPAVLTAVRISLQIVLDNHQ